MEVIYRAFDGTEFREAAPCVTYEQNHRVHAWDYHGRECTSANAAVVVHLEDPHMTLKFLQMCTNENVTHDGINEGDCGWFMWDVFSCEWQYIESEVVQLFHNILENYHV